MDKPKILYFDIETSLALAYVWSCGKQYVGIDQIKKAHKVLTIGYMWDTDKKPTILKCDMKKHNLNSYDDDSDKQLLKKFSEVYNQADLVVAHNGLGFDIPRLRARLAVHGLPDFAPVLVDDTYQKVKGLGFLSHKLDHLSNLLLEDRKLTTGYALWVDIMHGDEKALEKMAKYNAKDVVLLKKLHQLLMPYMKSSLNKAVFDDSGKLKCISPTCNGDLRLRDGNIITKLARKKKYQCVKCGKYCTIGINQLENTKYLPRAV